ncbi:MAG: Ig-like domain-containing protein [bacterium]
MKKFALLLMYPFLLLGQAQVVSVSPQQNEINVLLNTNIQVTFDVEMDSASINDTTFIAIGSFSGLHPGNIIYASATNRATLDPDNDFITGELVLVILTSGVTDSTGIPIDGYTWSFTTAATNGLGVFQAPILSSANNGPYGICAGYINTDNNLDLVVANQISQDISVLFGNGDGTFAPPVNYNTGDLPYAVACGDFDQDGDNDCIVACAGADSIFSYLNDGTGGLNFAGQFATGVYPLALFISDFNQDGYIDVSTVNRSSNTISVLMGNGDGTFQDDSQYSAGNGPSGITGGDFDGDGDIDLMISIRNTSKALIYFNQGDGLFSAGSQVGTGVRPNDIFAASLNSADTYLDVCTVNQLANTVTSLLGNGDGTFVLAGAFPTSDEPVHLIPTDIDTDGDMDIIASNAGDDSISMFFNDGSGHFPVLVNYYGGDSVARLCSGDFDNDGSIDIAVACFNTDSIVVLLNYSDNTPPGPPQNLVANGANPSPWTNYYVFEIDWTNPPDTSGIKRALYKLSTAPTSNFDTTGTMSGIPPDSAAATLEAGQMLYVWLEDNAGNLDFNNYASVELRYDGTDPSGSNASSPLYSVNEDFTVNWTSGSDTGGSGLSGTYDVRVKDGSGSWTPWLTNYSGLSSTYSGTDGHIYYFEAGARDNAGNIEVFTGISECSTYVDTTSPFVYATVPADSDTGITPNTNITARFSESMDSTTIIVSNFSIQGSQSGNHTFIVSYGAADSSAYLNPDMNFAFSETITVTVQSDVADIAGNAMANDEVWSFSVGSVLDTLGPITSSVNASPNPPEPIANVTITAFVSDAGQGDNNINAAEFFIDTTGTNGTGLSMSPVDTFWDEISEDVKATLNTQTLNWSANDTHKIYIHGLDAPGNWGPFDSVSIVVTADDDSLGPSFANFTPIQWPDTIGFYIECRITDPSGIFDDSTGSQGQGVYLFWDNDGELVVDAHEATMFNSSGSYYRTDSLIPAQVQGSNFVYEVYAYDNDFDTQHPSDRTQGTSGLQNITIIDVRGPAATNILADPNPTWGAAELALTGIISDTLLGNSNIYGAEYFIDVPGTDSTGNIMSATDGLFDEVTEDVYDTLDISSWQIGSTRWLFVHGLDAAGNWGDFDSVLVYVSNPEDTIPPYVMTTSPDSGETGVSLNRNIYIVFSEPLDTSSLDTTKFHISGSINPYYSYTYSYDTLDYAAVGLNPDSLFAVNETIFIDVSQAIIDTAGNGMLVPYSFYFITSSTVDTIGPVVQTPSAYPDTTEGAHLCIISAVISDSTTGMSPIRGGEIFVDSIGPNGSGQSMIPNDSIWDEIAEDVHKQVDISLLSLGVHWFYLHGRDDADNWGDIDSLSIIVTPDDDTLGPTFSDFYPDSVPDTCGFYIYCAITDPSGVYDDSTGSNGQGVYLLWDDDGELLIDSHEAKMSLLSGDTFRIDIEIPQQANNVNFVYEIFAYDNDFDFNEPQDRTQAQSGMQNIIVYDGLGPYTSYTQVSPPNPPAGISQVVVYATVSDSATGSSIINGAEAFLDSVGANGTGIAMLPLDSIFDEIQEEVFDTIPVSGWQVGENHTFYVHGRDVQGNWGFFDSTTVYVIEYIDTIPPWVGLTFPDSGELDIPLNTWIYVTFSEPVDPTTVTSDKVLIDGHTGGNYSFWMSYNSMDSTLSINPYNDFAPYESVDVYIASGIQDLAGNPMTSSFWWWFRTGAASDTLSPTVTAIDVTPDTVQPAEFVVLTGSLIDNQEVSNAEFFIDSIGSNGSGYAVLPVDSFGLPVVDVFDTIRTDTMTLGSHMVYLHGIDASGNWGEVDSVLFVIGGDDTLGPIFDIIVDPSPAYIGDSIYINALPNEVLNSDSAVVCSVWTSAGALHVLDLLPDTVGYGNWLGTVGFASGVCRIKVAGYDVWLNNGFSETNLSITPRGEFLPEEMVYAWPNPARGNTINFHFYINANADITIDIFNLEGKRVTQIDGRGEGGRPPHQESSNAITWNTSGIASDVYLFRINATSDATGETRSVIKKFAIVK